MERPLVAAMTPSMSAQSILRLYGSCSHQTRSLSGIGITIFLYSRTSEPGIDSLGRRGELQPEGAEDVRLLWGCELAAGRVLKASGVGLALRREPPAPPIPD